MESMVLHRRDILLQSVDMPVKEVHQGLMDIMVLLRDLLALALLLVLLILVLGVLQLELQMEVFLVVQEKFVESS
jgi:hypothetical protein